MRRLLFIFGFLYATHSVAQDDCKHGLAIPFAKQANSTWSVTRVNSLCQLTGFYDGGASTTMNTYGGRTDWPDTIQATGFFYTKKINGRWWIIDPVGRPFIHKGITSIRPGNVTSQKAAFLARYGGSTSNATARAAWINETKQVLANNGFNGVGGFCDEDVFPHMGAYTMICNFMSTYRSQRPYTKISNGVYVFDTQWITFCDNHAATFAQYKNDPMLLGFFTDNELYFQTGGKGDLMSMYLSLPKGDPCRDSTDAWLKKEIPTGTPTTYEAVPLDKLNKFLGYAGRRYYKAVYEALKRHCPNHMVIGSRNFTVERQNNDFMSCQRGYVDIVSINYYQYFSPVAASMADWERLIGAPFIVSEFYAKAMDTGLPNTDGAGYAVRTQFDRAMYYQNFLIGLMKSKVCVGWHWFRYQDNDNSLGEDNGDANKGIVDNAYNPHNEMLGYMKDINDNVYKLADYLDAQDNIATTADKVWSDAATYVKGETTTVPKDANATDQQLWVKNFTSSPANIREVFLRFNFNHLTEEVKSAVVRFYQVQTGWADYEVVLLDTNTWDPATLKMSNRPQVGTVLYEWSMAGSDPAVEIDVTNYVNNIITNGGEKKVSLRIHSTKTEQTSDQILKIGSAQNITESYRPVMLIENASAVVNDEAKLSGILINGSNLKGFNVSQSSYNLKLSHAEDTVIFDVKKEYRNTIVAITPPANLQSANAADRAATIVVTSSTNGALSYTYTIVFSYENVATPLVLSATGVGENAFVARWRKQSNVTGYRLYVYNSSDVVVAAYNGVGVLDTLWNVSKLSVASKYGYRVQAMNGKFSSELSAKQIVNMLVSKPISLPATAIGTNSFKARWEPVLGCSSYKLYVKDAVGNTLPEYNGISVSDTVKVVSGLLSATGYKYQVSAIHPVSGETELSQEIVLTTSPEAPVALSATNVTGTTFISHWKSVVRATGYKLYVYNGANVLPAFNGYTTNDTTVSVVGLVTGTNYSYKVQAMCGVQVSDWSNSVGVATNFSAPRAIVATAVTDTSFMANWNPSSGATGYKLYVKDAGGNLLPSYNGIMVYATQKLVSGLIQLTSYSYYVTAMKGDVESGASNEIQVATLKKADEQQTAVDEVLSSMVLLYPNPSSGVFYVTGECVGWKYRVLDRAGGVVASGVIGQLPCTINLTDKVAGTYFIAFESPEGRIVKSITKK